MARPELVRQASEDQTKRMMEIPKWDESDHPVVIFVRQGDNVKGMKVLSKDKEFIEKNLTPVLKNALFSNGILDKNWDYTNISNDEAIGFLNQMSGGNPEDVHEAMKRVLKGYMITADNLIKMVCILYRLQSQLPVLIMGETGCGKSSLITQMSAVVDATLFTLNVHGGMHDEDIVDWIQQHPMKAFQALPEDKRATTKFTVFLDEVNTCNCMGLFKEILCDRSMNGEPLPDAFQIVAACNPYRKRNVDAKLAEHSEMGGLAFDEDDGADDMSENVGTGIRDPLKDLVYRVHPLPEAMVDHVFDFGALAPTTESLFIRAKLANMLNPYRPQDLWQVKMALSKLPGVGDAWVKTEGIRVVGYVTPVDDDEDQLKATLESLGEWQPPMSKRPGQTRSENWLFKDLGFIAPGTDQLSANEHMKDLPLHLWPAIISSVKGFQTRTPEKEKIWQNLQDHGLEREGLFETLDALEQTELDNLVTETKLDEKGITDEVEVATLLQAGIVGKPVDLRGKEAKVPKDGRTSTFTGFIEVFGDYVCVAQEFVRELSGGERSSASMRDVVRCIIVYKWFLKHLAEESTHPDQGPAFTFEDALAVKEPTREKVLEAIELSLAYCYQARLPTDHRKELRERLSAEPAHAALAPWLRIDRVHFVATLEKTQKSFVKHMHLSDGIALNEALCENLFMMLVSVLNTIPIFVIGKPGSSKSLAMRLLMDNLKGEDSHNAFLKKLPRVEVFSYQCSPLSTSNGIESTVQMAHRYKQSSTNTITIVLLDEVGLAEQSPHLPLKVLHKVLDEAGPGEALVGISNWSLDPAKMNRAVHLYRPAPSVEDLANTAEGMVQNVTLKSYLQAISRSYSKVYEMQQSSECEVRTDFWGLREFYSTVKFIAGQLQQKKGEKVTIDAPMLLQAVLRNFGGYPDVTAKIVEIFFNEIGVMTGQGVALEIGVTELIKQNVVDQDARHLMLLTKNSSALPILFDQQILSHETCDIIIGSDFPLDQSDLQICHNIQRIKQKMQEGATVVLLHCDNLYESLYDLLNQHYTKYGDQKFVRLAFGTHSRLCPVHDNFRAICIAERIDAYTKLAPPLLNRFEKQVLQRTAILTDDTSKLLHEIEEFATMLVKEGRVGGNRKGSALGNRKGSQFQQNATLQSHDKLKTAFCGFYSDYFCSLALLVIQMRADKEAAGEAVDVGEEDEGMSPMLKEAVERLLWCTTPEVICQLISSGNKVEELKRATGLDIHKQYFREQHHSTLSMFAQKMLPKWRDKLGAQAWVMTYAPLTPEVPKMLAKTEIINNRVTSLCLHELSSERDLTRQVQDFFQKAEDGSLLLVQCDPLAASLRRVQHARFICEQERAHYYSKFASSGKTMPIGVHMMVLLHLPRGSDMQYCMDFSPQWRCAFVDAMEDKDHLGLPSIEEVVGESQSLSQIVAQLKLRPVLQQEFRRSLSKLHYPHKRDNSDVHRHINCLTSCLRDDDFLATVRAEVLALIQDKADSSDLVQSARKADRLNAAGTFQAAMHIQIIESVSVMFAFVLEHMDRNYGLQLYDQEEKRPMWLYLFHRYMPSPKNTFNMKNHSFEVLSDAFKENRGGARSSKHERFELRFPFSFYLNRELTAMRETAEQTGNPEQYLRDQLAIEIERGLPQGITTDEKVAHITNDGKDKTVEKLLAGEMADRKLLYDYVRDFTYMQLPKVEGCDRHVQASVLWQILQNCSGDGVELSTVSSVHARFWQVERPVQLYFQLMNTVPTSAPEVTSRLMGLKTGLTTIVHLQVMQLAFNKLDPWLQGWESVVDYFKWMQTIEQAELHIDSLFSICRLQLDQDSESSQAAEAKEAIRAHREHWDRIKIFYSFIHDVAWPLSVKPSFALSHLKGVQGQQIRTQASFRTLLKLACHKELPAQCEVTEEDETVFLAKVRRATSRFIQHFIFDVCFSDTGTAELEMPILTDFISVLAEDPPEESSGVNVLGTEASRVALFRKLLDLPAGEKKEQAWKELQARMMQMVKTNAHVDTNMSATYVNVKEEELMKVKPPAGEMGLRSEGVQMLKLADLDLAKTSLPDMLECCAKVRYLVGQYAQRLCLLVDQPDDDSMQNQDLDQATKELEQLQPQLDEMLDTNASSDGVVRSMRMFFLKTLDRMRGVSFVRSALQQRPLKDANWVKEWTNSRNDTTFQLFVGNDRMPKGNPLKTLPLYSELGDALSSSLASGMMETFEQQIDVLKAKPEVKGAVLGTLFHQIFLMSVLPGSHEEDAEQYKKLCSTRTWAGTYFKGSDLKLGELGQTLIHHFAGAGIDKYDNAAAEAAEAAAGATGSVPDPCKQMLTLTPGTASDRIQQVRVIAHLASLALNAEAAEGRMAHFLHMLLKDPGTYADKYLPTMPQDEFFLITDALRKAEGGGQYNQHAGVRWKKCKNCGYRFYIADCGGATTSAKCPECKKDIGGAHHKSNENTADIDDTQIENQIFAPTQVKDDSPKGICLRSHQEEDDTHSSVRDLQSKVFRAIRCLINGTLYLGCTVLGEEYKLALLKTFNRSLNPNPPATKDMQAFFHNHFVQDIRILRALLGDMQTDDVCMLLHSCIEKLDVVTENAAGGNTASMATIKQRDQWEANASKEGGMVETLVADELDKRLEAIAASFGASGDNVEETSVFMAELSESFRVHDVPVAERCKKSHLLWVFRPSFNLSKFSSRLLNPEVAKEHGLLAQFVTVEPKLRGLRHFPAVVEWCHLLQTRYGRRLTMKRATEMTVEDVLAEQPEDQRAHWESVFEEFATAWNKTWEHVKANGCLQMSTLPQEWRDIKQSQSTCIVFSLLSDKDAGILLSSLIDFMVNQHNEIVRRVDEVMLLTKGEGHRDQKFVEKIPAMDSAPIHMLEYDMHGKFLPFVQKHCVEFQIGGVLEYDFATAEQYLIDLWLCKPELDAKIGQFSFLEEEEAKNALKMLARVVPQEPLPKEFEAQIRSDLGTDIPNAQQCMIALSTCVSFLKGNPSVSAAGTAGPQQDDVASKLGNLVLGDYATKALNMDASDFVSSTVSTSLRLKHLEGLHKLLLGMLSPDPTDMADGKYKKGLDPQQREALKQAYTKLDIPKLLEEMSNFMSRAAMKEGSLSTQASLKEVFAYHDVGDEYMDDFEWYHNCFPDEFKMEQFVEVFRALKLL
jgi:hypothetical protein